MIKQKEVKRHMDKKLLKFVFGEAAENSVEIYNRIKYETSNNKHQYTYLTSDAFVSIAQKEGAGWTNQYCCMEILQRIYFAALTGYFRQQRWIEGICNAVDTNNYLLFCSSIRGFLESATDYYDALECIPLTLAEQFKVFNRAIRGAVTDRIIIPGDLESILLHFQEASKKSDKKGKVYNPKTAREYMESKNLKALNLYECYGELCEVTHPAKNSLELFINDDDYIYMFSDQDERLMKEFVNKYSDQLANLYTRTENLCIVILQVLNLFGVREYYSPAAASLKSDNIRIWEKINELIK